MTFGGSGCEGCSIGQASKIIYDKGINHYAVDLRETKNVITEILDTYFSAHYQMQYSYQTYIAR